MGKLKMELRNVYYNHWSLGSKPYIAIKDYSDDIYPKYPSDDYIPKESIEELPVIQRHYFRLAKDENYTKNKFILSVLFLQADYITPNIGNVDVQTLDTAVRTITKGRTEYSYFLNEKKILKTMNLILTELKTKDADFNKRIPEYVADVINGAGFLVTHCNSLGYVVKFHPTELSGFEYVYNTDSLVEALCSFEVCAQDDPICKYCLSKTPMGELIRVCDCSTPVHIRCFTAWINQKKHRLETCEICHGKLLVNEPAIHADMCGDYPETRCFFPFCDFYPVPLFDRMPLKKYSGVARYNLALMYLQHDRLEKLLQESCDDNVKKGMSNCLAGFRSGSMASNYLRSLNKEKYKKSGELLFRYGLL